MQGGRLGRRVSNYKIPTFPLPSKPSGSRFTSHPIHPIIPYMASPNNESTSNTGEEDEEYEELILVAQLDGVGDMERSAIQQGLVTVEQANSASPMVQVGVSVCSCPSACL